MNPQPPEYVGNLLAILFFSVVAWYSFKEFKNGTIINLANLDMINIGYLDDPHIVNVIQTTSSATQSFESQQLYLDCIEALHALGMKKSEAKKKAKNIFSTFDPAPTTVQEFLMIALRN